MYVLGIDLGTSFVKAALFDLAVQPLPRLVAVHAVPVHVAMPLPGHVEQDPDAAVVAARTAIDGTMSEAAGRLGVVPQVEVTGCSGAMHSLLPLDAADRPLTRAILWADVRSANEAEALREGDEGADIARRTGTPLHPMSPLCKLLWMKAHAPDLLDRARRFTGLKEYVVARLFDCGTGFMDRSMASATGLFNWMSGQWDAQLLERIGISSDRMPDVVDGASLLEGTRKRVALGGGDGPLANLGCGAIAPGLAALTVGTSGAVRVCTPSPTPDADGRSFCYFLSRDMWIGGAAISNAGNLLEWGRQLLGLSDVAALLHEASRSSAEDDVPMMLPYLAGERSPHWNPHASGALFGLRLHHGPSHIARAMVEATAYAMRDGIASLPRTEAPIRHLIASGGITRSPYWLQTMADVTGLPVAVSRIPEASALGAALLAAGACGVCDDLTEVAARLAANVEPAFAPAHTERHARRFELYRRLYSATHPFFKELAV